MAGSSPIRLGISRCLLGDHVRYDGGHQRNDYLVDVLGRLIEWVSVCPEVEAGLGSPREPMQLVGLSGRSKLITISTQQDQTSVLTRFSTRRVRELRSLNLSGYVFKARSPSCGIDDVPLYDRHGKATRTGSGLFARAFRTHFPLVPVIDEARLADPASRQHFLEQVFGYHRWNRLTRRSVTCQALVRFHRGQADLLQLRGPGQRRALNQLMAQATRYRVNELVARYGRAFIHALRSPSRVGGRRMIKGMPWAIR